MVRFICFVFLFLSSVSADSERGLQIAVAADNRDKGFGDSVSEMKMILRDKHGRSTERDIRNRSLEGINEGDKSLVIFDSPGDVKGTAFLSHTKKVGSDDQWLYLPALKRVKRIASSNKAGPFMGSEFAYEDIASQEVEKYSYRFLREEKLGKYNCYVVESDPVDPKSGYSKRISWIDSEEYRPLKIEFYDRKKSLLKTLTYDGYREYQNKYWRADSMYMENHQTGKTTQLIFSNWDFGNGFEPKDFRKNALKRIR